MNRIEQPVPVWADESLPLAAREKAARDQLDRMVVLLMQGAKQHGVVVGTMSLGEIAQRLVAGVPMLKHVPVDVVTLALFRTASQW